MKRTTITWRLITEEQPSTAGTYLVTTKAWPSSDPFRKNEWDGHSVSVGFDRYIPGGRPHIIRGQWWTKRADDVIAWAEMPKPYEITETGKKAKKK